jgi:NAD(P)-dependent dehydrogenase (short-subunit alcohol dehydrogenase family)
MELGLTGKAALVTGASEGIGMAIARRLVQTIPSGRVGI